ncbi:MAG: hypothetical protein IE926_05725 [Micrococcales bacterium]|nr:hypothetical protein [Micrococcales bacterium]
MPASEFVTACREASRQLRRLPVEVRRELRTRVRAEVADPIAQDVRGAGRSVYARRVAPTARVRSAADPTIVVGGSRRVASGGATGRNLVFGAHFGGGRRTTAVPATSRHRGYRRRSTRQFAGQRDPFVFGTVNRNLDRYLERWAGIIDDVVERVIGHG